MNNQETLHTLKQLHKICTIGKRGFNIVANSVTNRGLKLMLKGYAQQRHQMAGDLEAMIETLGGNVSKRRSVLGMIHRGRIVIMSTLAIGPTSTESVALKEAAFGEKVALRTYRGALNKALMSEARTLVKSQFQQIQAVSEKINRLLGLSGEQLTVSLFDSEQAAETAVAALEKANFSQDGIKIVNLNEVIDFSREYHENEAVTMETTLSGMVGGAIWGSLLGAVAGIGFLLFPDFEPFMAATLVGTWVLTTLTGTVSGAVIGGILGFIIGLGTSEDDAYLYDASLEQGTTMVLLNTTSQRAPRASKIMYQVNQHEPTQ